MTIDFQSITTKAASYREPMASFLRDMIAIPSESGKEKDVVQRIRQEMEVVGFDRIKIDGLGNILGYIGNGPHLIAMDAHIDTVGIGDPSLWKSDPYKGYADEELVPGRGASDQEGGMASMVYAARIIKELDLANDYTLLVTGTVMEEDCDGLCWQYIIKESGIRPEFVVSTEPTSCQIYRGHRGRMELTVTVKGLSCHGSAPERGDNALYKAGRILLEIEKLNTRLAQDDFLGKGTVTATQFFFSSPSQCAVPDAATIQVDRRLTVGETEEIAVAELLDAAARAGYPDAKVDVLSYEEPAYTGLVYPTKKYYPTWCIPEEAPATQTLVESYRKLFHSEPTVDKWTFSTNGVAIMGMHGIPCIGFGPGHEDQAHAPNEVTWKNELVKCAAMYAAIPSVYCEKYAQ
ncbi:MAG: YgeY family selenium metabolism-linked hydrolase [Spartobacteria bacterium]|nr:YgeY family selenium metabolism-linked hydrolase [Spartobacteria bacterium]